jgi:hypothetical protein
MTNEKEHLTEATKSLAECDPMVEKPPHYNATEIECIDYISDSLGDGIGFYLEGSLKKYLHRWRHKHDSQSGRVQELKKARWYLDKLIADVEDHDVPVCHQ